MPKTIIDTHITLSPTKKMITIKNLYLALTDPTVVNQPYRNEILKVPPTYTDKYSQQMLAYRDKSGKRFAGFLLKENNINLFSPTFMYDI